jgi:hypothetical protein
MGSEWNSILQTIRGCLKQCEDAEGDAHIAAELFDSDGGIDNKYIACSACADPSADDDNDILLCDGDLCNRAYHVRCLPVKDSFDVESLPENIGWLCPACDCRYDILWNLAETFEMLFESLTTCRCSISQSIAQFLLRHPSDGLSETMGLCICVQPFRTWGYASIQAVQK